MKKCRVVGNLSSQLFVAIIVRGGNLDECFTHAILNVGNTLYKYSHAFNRGGESA